MTLCTICGLPTGGRDTDNEACCLACFTANLAGAELRPPASVTRGWGWQAEEARRRQADVAHPGAGGPPFCVPRVSVRESGPA